MPMLSRLLSKLPDFQPKITLLKAGWDMKANSIRHPTIGAFVAVLVLLSPYVCRAAEMSPSAAYLDNTCETLINHQPPINSQTVADGTFCLASLIMLSQSLAAIHVFYEARFPK